MVSVLVPTLALHALYDAKIRLKSSMTQPVAAAAGSVSLDHYMQLPVEQYCAIPLPMQASLTRTPRTDEFEMRVPPLVFSVPGKPLTVAPLVLATVVSEGSRVVIASDSCTLTGSPEAMRLIEATRLNDRFDFSVRQHGQRPSWQRHRRLEVSSHLRTAALWAPKQSVGRLGPQCSLPPSYQNADSNTFSHPGAGRTHVGCVDRRSRYLRAHQGRCQRGHARRLQTSAHAPTRGDRQSRDAGRA